MVTHNSSLQALGYECQAPGTPGDLPPALENEKPEHFAFRI